MTLVESRIEYRGYSIYTVAEPDGEGYRPSFVLYCVKAGIYDRPMVEGCDESCADVDHAHAIANVRAREFIDRLLADRSI